MEAAQFAIRFTPIVQRFYQRKAAKRHLMVARKSVAHKLARAWASITASATFGHSAEPDNVTCWHIISLQ